jgi:tyrosinase
VTRNWGRSVLALFLFALAACRSTSTGPQTGGATFAGGTFSGVVVDQQAKPVEGARVEVNGRDTTSRSDGSFALDVPSSDRYLLNITHPDYAEVSVLTRSSIKGQRWILVRGQSQTVDPTQPITLTDARPELAAKGLGGATLNLPANALVDPAGSAPAGMVHATIATLDVANGEGPSEWAARADDGTDAFLVSYGAVSVQFTDPAGKVRYQLRSGKAADLSLPVLPNMKAFAPNNPTAQFWYYEPKDGYWKKMADAAFNAGTGAYVGKVTHLSTLNTDIAKTNAACLKITLDPSIAPGNKLRVRYHSGGTPFGQTPILVMSDVDNAMFRLPANTNVLLELLDASNQVFGNLVVEDPPGTPLVNTVIGTGPQIPAGHTLWPGPPYADCHPVLLRLGLPQVELRINELSTDSAMLRDDPTDDYVTWAPTFCRARLSTPGAPVTVVLTNDPPGNIAGGGDVNFADFVNPWPANTTATNNTVTLNLPGDGSYVSFVIAGKFQHASTNDKDTIIEAHMNTAGGALIGTKALMVRVRKNANTLTASERARYLFAIRHFRNQLGTNYVLLQEMHRLAQSITNDQGHKQPAFLPWHRAMLLQVERELQKIDPSVALHYWNWDAAAPALFSQDFIGASDPAAMSYIDKPVFSITNPLNGWDTNLPFASGDIQRNTDDHSVFAGAGFFKPLDDAVDPSLVGDTDYGTYSSGHFDYECERLAHNYAHGWPCGGGHLNSPARSAADPLFYLLHSQTERQWAYWQQKNNRFGVIVASNLTFPAPTHYENNGNWNDVGASAFWRGAFLEDTMWPWDGTTGGAGRAQRPPNQAVMPFDENVPNSTPVVPMSPFPASLVHNLWPASPAMPRPRDMIDYLGRFQPNLGLGYCYDDVPY